MFLIIFRLPRRIFTRQTTDVHVCYAVQGHIHVGGTSFGFFNLLNGYFNAVLFFMLYKRAIIFKSVNETLVCDQSNESYCAVLSCSTVGYSTG